MKKTALAALPSLIVVLFLLEMAAVVAPKPERDFRWRDFGRLPVLLSGRVQPLDSVGRNALLQLRSTGDVPLEEKKSYEFWKHPRKLKATEWIMEAMMKPELADTRPVFLVHHPDLLNELELRGKGIEKSGLFYFSYNELTNCIEKVEKEGRQAMGVETSSRTAYQKQVAKLHNALSLYRQVKNSLQPEDCQDFLREIGDLRKAAPAGIAALKAREAGQEYDKPAFEKFAALASQYDFMARLAYPMLVPPSQPATNPDAWRNMGQALFEFGVHGAELPPAVTWIASMASAYRNNDPARFNQSLDEYRQWLAANLPGQSTKGTREFFFNQLQPFLHAMVTYGLCLVAGLAGLLTLSFWPAPAEALRRMAWYGAIAAWSLHTAGLIFRMVLEGRPPVTNLYSSAIFVGWMSVLLGLILERIFRVGIGVTVGSILGFFTLILAQSMALGGDTMEMLRAVLDTNFWLATHVVTIALGYAANFVAGLLGAFYVVFGLFTPLLGQKLAQVRAQAEGRSEAPSAEANGTLDVGQVLGKMVYAIICFAMLFTFIGTVLGGIWADQSWGRFWGWDPKENGALIIVLWNALILHALRDGMVRERGLMNLAIFGSIVTYFSWKGVNMLGIGLHSYGFTDAAFREVTAFVAVNTALILLGSVPASAWRSYRERALKTPPSLPSSSGSEPAGAGV